MNEKQVLAEEVYVACLAYIIRRDFFPNAPNIDEVQLPEEVYELTLGQFHAHYKSEDHQTFEEILDTIHQKHKEKYYWIDANEVHKRMIEYKPQTGKERRLVLKSKDEQDAPAVIETWKYKPNNELMFFHNSSVPKQRTGGEMKTENTRIRDFSADDRVKLVQSVLKSKKQPQKAYDLVLTPARETEDSVPEQTLVKGFSIPENSKREKIGRELSEKVERKHRLRADRTPNRSTMSPAAWALLSRRGKASGMKNELRQSYNSPLASPAPSKRPRKQ